MTPDRELCRGVTRLSSHEQLSGREEQMLLNVCVCTGLKREEI